MFGFLFIIRHIWSIFLLLSLEPARALIFGRLPSSRCNRIAAAGGHCHAGHMSGRGRTAVVARGILGVVLYHVLEVGTAATVCQIAAPRSGSLLKEKVVWMVLMIERI